MKEIFRVEDINHVGVYRPEIREEYLDAIELHMDWNMNSAWPAPEQDSIECSRDDLFAFESISQMQRWFIGTERLYLSAFGIFLSLYKVPNDCIKYGQYQIAFKKDLATFLWRKPLNHF